MNNEVSVHAHKAELPPGTLVYTGKRKGFTPTITVVHYDKQNFYEASGAVLEECLPKEPAPGVTWVNISGLFNVELVKEVGNHFGLHPLTIEDIVNIEQRSKVDEFENYVFIVLKRVFWNERKKIFSVEQMSIAFGEGFFLTFQEQESGLFSQIIDRLRNGQNRLRDQGSDFLAYAAIDTIVDQFFVVLERLGERIDQIEDFIIASPSQQNARNLYRLKRQMLMFRKAVWPSREVVNHLLRVDAHLVTPYTAIYLRDVYDHTMQAIDTVETFRDMLAGLLDVYMSSVTNRMNEVMKVLTIIATLFIPLTFVASIYGMNFDDMPELHWHYGYPAVLTVMFIVALLMIIYFKRKKWL